MNTGLSVNYVFVVVLFWPGFESGKGVNWAVPSGMKFLQVLIFAIFPAIRKKIKYYRKHFFRKNLLQSKYSLT